MQFFEKDKRVIIALHGWTGNISSLKCYAKYWNFTETNCVYIQAPYKAKYGGYSWFNGNNKEGWRYEKSFQKLKKKEFKAYLTSVTNTIKFT
tara:strand:+ start:263 stop:538 length:276 start_codon:yes stop_codon:yes gene_type:complete